jgi:two-component system phosphate regulon response regulator PhoB
LAWRTTSSSLSASASLLLRIDAVLRRGRIPEQGRIEVEELRIDQAAHRVTVGTEEIALTALEFRLLMTMIERRGRVQARSTLVHEVWGFNAGIESRTVDTHVKRLRDELGTAGRFFETVRGVGYLFTDLGSGESG